MKWFGKKREAHRHRWEALEVKHGMVEALGVAGTQILLLCEACGEYSTQTIYGHWELAEVRGKPGQDQELVELRKMAGIGG